MGETHCNPRSAARSTPLDDSAFETIQTKPSKFDENIDAAHLIQAASEKLCFFFGSVRCSQSAGPTDPCERLLGPAPTCVQPPAVLFNRNRWRRNGKSLSPLAGPAFFFLSLFPSSPHRIAAIQGSRHFNAAALFKETAAATQRRATFTYLPVRCSTCKCKTSFFLPDSCITGVLSIRKEKKNNAKHQIGFELKKKK